MSKIVLTNSPEISLDIKETFTYNYYEESEALTNDFIIKDDNKNPYKFIKLEINSKALYDNRVFKFLDNVNLENIKSFSDKNITKSDLTFFNKIHDQDKETRNINIDKSDDEIMKINSFFNIDSSNFVSAINFIKSNKKVCINNSIYDELAKDNINNIFFTKDVNKSIKTYKDVLEPNEAETLIQKQYNKLVINKGFKTFLKTSVYNESVDIESYYLNVGFLFEKYEVEDNGKFNKVTSYFKYNSNNEDIVNKNRTISHTIRDNFTLKDSAVKYGKTYMYIVYPVYITSIPTKSDYHTYDQYIVCGYPYFTKNILCKEKKRPIPPAQLFFKYNETSKKLKVSWSNPLELQGDIKGYQVFKRFSLDDPFVLVKQIEFHSKNDVYDRNQNVSAEIIENINNKNITQYIDDKFRPKSLQIYCICSIDAHGFVSNYSSQYCVKYDAGNKKCIIDLVSTSGAPLHMPNLLIPRKTKFYDNDDYIVTNTPVEEKVNKFTLYVTPEFNRINIDAGSNDTVLKDTYKLNIFKLENSSNHIDSISITNFDNI
jgi:hypothetical protein